jgi:hypothetical protein
MGVAVEKFWPCLAISSTVVRTSTGAYESAPSTPIPTSDSPRIRGLTSAPRIECGTRVRLTCFVALADLPGRVMSVGNT